MLELDRVSVRFSARTAVQAVDDVSLTLKNGERLAMIGETGSGKSVLLLAALRLLPPTAVVSGRVLLDGENILTAEQKRLRQIRGGRISYVPQGGGGSMNPLLTVGFQAGEPLMEHKGFSQKAAVQAAVGLFRALELGNEKSLARAYPHMFSGGMRQRALVAMGMSAGAEILFADEPTKGLDRARVTLVADTFNRLEGRSLLCVTHDLPFARSISRTLCVLYAGQQVELGETAQLFTHPLHPYTQAMLDALPENGMRCPAAGLAPQEQARWRTGCRYGAQCPHRLDKCGQAPPLVFLDRRAVRCWKYAD